MSKSFKNIETKLIHAGEASPRIKGAAVLPIFQSATYEYSGETSYHDVRYIRLNNTPNHLVLHEKLAALENAEAAIVAASGMAAITTTLLTVLKAGDHLLAQSTLYGGTHDFITRDFAGFGISFDFIDASDPGSWKSKLRPNTRAIYVETISNPTLEVGDLSKVVEFARENNLVSLVDNTFASPVNFRAAEYGFDVSLHSCTKYLNGHSDIVAGACIGRADLIERVLHKLNHMGGTLDPHAAFLLHRGMKTLALRVRHQNESAIKIAQFLESHPAIAKVNYPGLENHPGHRIARELFDGFGGMVSFEVRGGLEAAERFIQRATLPIVAPSLGGVETLLTRPASTSHLGMPREAREKIGITDSLVRLSVGIEATGDLIEDFDRALNEVG
ncbi:MAG TPA: aminotransferase class I/II-fold pyridoxal phosphate-dependent enzyme [Blastocatellia bacterium]|jgi:cystathionine beta-lyase/cystathionine gamma-synthase|nr:aminotransferase class I/II-fold pyridoxal phosphate-dependent enzyme [Blastocatellia bacterium]